MTPKSWHQILRAKMWLIFSVGKTQTENELNQTLKSRGPNEFKLKLNSDTL